MKKLFLVLLTAGLTLNGYWTYRVVKFSKASEKYLKYLELKTDCLQAKVGMDSNDIYLAAHGKTREMIKDKVAKEFLPVRSTYDLQNKECNSYAKYMCWTMDLKDPANVENCHKNFMTDKEYEEFKKTGKAPWEQKNGK